MKTGGGGRGSLRDLIAGLILLATGAAFLWDVLFGGKVLLPADDLFTMAPWRDFAAQFGIGAPHNHLIADMIIQNLSWKTFAKDAVLNGSLPLWNPYLLAGVPFLAAGQYAVIYPLGFLFYILPVTAAYGWFTLLHLFIGGLGMYVFLRVIAVGRTGALAGALTFAFSAFLVVSFLWPMVVSTAVWLPLLLAFIELTVRGITIEDGAMKSAIPDDVVGPAGTGVTAGDQRDVPSGDFASLAPSGDFASLAAAAHHYRVSEPGQGDRGRGEAGDVVGPAGIGVTAGDQRDVPSGDFASLAPAGDFASLATAAQHHRVRAASEGDRDRAAGPRVSRWLWPLLGALVVALQFLAGHMEISFYVLFTAGFYAACRLGIALWQTRRKLRLLAAACALLGMIGLGTGLAAVQIVPFAEAIGANFRAGFVTYDDVAGYALPKQRAVSFLIPDFFGNPSVHSYWNALTGQMEPARHLDARGNTVDFVADWDRKNYVEGAAYAGILPLLLAGFALIYRRSRYTWIFAAYAAWSLLLAFGSPLYRIFFYGIPGFDQLHTPFRWLFPYTASVAVLAGIGAGWLAEHAAKPRSFRRLALAILAVALLLVAGLAASLPLHGRLIARLQPIVERSDRLKESFGNATGFFAFEWRNLAVFALFLALGAAILLLVARRPAAKTGRSSVALISVAISVAIAADLFVFGLDFNTRGDPAALDFVPPAVAFLQQDREPYRIVSVGETDVLTPNTAMRFGVQDARGYDTIIPRQFVDFWSLIEDPRGYLIYSKIHKLREAKSLESPLLSLLNVKYALSAGPLDVPGYQLAYQGELYIYRNMRVLPRAFIVDDPAGLHVAADRAAVAALLGRPDFDPSRELVLEDGDAPRLSAGPASAKRVEIDGYIADRVTLSASNSRDGYLLLADSYFPGWEATVDGQAATVYRADGNFRAVYLPAGSHTVVFSYKPASFRAGLALSGVSLALLLLGVGYFLRPRGLIVGYGRAPVQRVAKNSMLPMATSLLNKLISAAFAMVVLRMLGPEGVGKYTFAIIMSSYFEIFTNFGLGTLLTREVAKDPAAGNRYLSNTIILRLALWLCSLPLVAGLIFFWHGFFGLDRDTALAIALLIVALVPGNLAAGFSALFYAHERMEYPAMVSIVTTLLTIALGTVALLAGWGFVGLALVAVIANVVTAGVFLALVSRIFWRPRPELDGPLVRRMAGTAAPLMLNHLLATLFFRVDVMLLQPMQGDRAVGYYGTAYRFVDALNIIPSAFTFAIFPLMSRYARDSRTALNRSYYLAVKLLLLVSLPIAVGTAFLAEPIVLFFGGPEYLPHAAIALQVLIWFLPFSYLNSVMQYVLIAVNQQRYITASFVVATSFNIAANLALIPRFGYAGAAFVTTLSEIVLLVPFLRGVWRHTGGIPLHTLAVRPCLASGAMAMALWTASAWHPLLLIPLGAAVYVIALFALRTFDDRDRLLLKQVIGHRE